MFEKASRLKLRFSSSKGQLTVEDLWDLPLLSTDGTLDLECLAQEHHSEVKQSKGKTFVKKKSTADSTAVLKMGIIKHVIEVKLDEEEKRKLAAEKRKNKARITELIAQKQDEELADKSIEELQELIADM